MVANQFDWLKTNFVFPVSENIYSLWVAIFCSFPVSDKFVSFPMSNFFSSLWVTIVCLFSWVSVLNEFEYLLLSLWVTSKLECYKSFCFVLMLLLPYCQENSVKGNCVNTFLVYNKKSHMETFKLFVSFKIPIN